MTNKRIGDGQRFDVNKVSKDGISKEEIEAAKKKNLRLANIFKTIDLDKSGDLSSQELALAMDTFKTFDEDGNSKLSNNEFLKMADAFRNEFGESFISKDFKDFMNVIRKTTKKDEKVSTQQLVGEYHDEVNHTIKMNTANNYAKEHGFALVEGHEGAYYDVENDMYYKLYEEGGKLSLVPAKYDEKANTVEYMTQEEYDAVMQQRAEAEAKAKAEAEAKAKAEAEAKAKAEAEAAEKAKPQHTYVVQSGDSFTEVIKKSLQAQGVENPTKEQIAQEKEKFKKYNPDAVKTAKNGVEYLLAGDEVKLHGEVAYEKSAEEAEAQWGEEHPDLKWKSPEERAAEEEAQKAAEQHKADLKAGKPEAVAQEAEKQGYRKTGHAETYYDEKTKTHYRWNNDEQKFVKFDADQVFHDGTYRKDGDLYAANGENLSLYLSYLSPKMKVEKKETGEKVRLKDKEQYASEDNVLMRKIAAGDNTKFNAEALITASDGLGTNETLFEAVLNAGKNVEYYEKLDKYLKEYYGKGLGELGAAEYGGYATKASDNVYYQQFFANNWAKAIGYNRTDAPLIYENNGRYYRANIGSGMLEVNQYNVDGSYVIGDKKYDVNGKLIEE